MKLINVEIHGFRSIDDMRITFAGCGHKVLVGKNESGKSNILKALNLLSGIAFEKKDKKTLYGDHAHVYFTLALDEDEINKCQQQFYKKTNVSLATQLTAELTVKEFIEHYANSGYLVHCEQACGWTYCLLRGDHDISGEWYVVNNNIIDTEFDTKIPPGSYVNKAFLEENLQDTAAVEEVIEYYLTPITIKAFYDALEQTIHAVVVPENHTFPVVNWRYNATEHDLPAFVNRQAFVDNLDSCIPLKNMFLLGGIKETEIGGKILDAFANGPNATRTLFNSIHRKANQYLKKIWQDFTQVEIELTSDGDDIVIGIKDTHSTFDFDQRSDGFRRLVSFLLLMATEGDAKATNKIILIDEPEVGLHPSSAKDLRNQLIELGKHNTVVYATHSISMIDTENIENNLIVTKENENTTYKVATEHGTSSAENIYQAIGHSIYEDLKKTNILLEGYTDKKMFALFIQGEEWENIGICYIGGVKNIAPITLILKLADRKYFILSDADETATQKKQQMDNPDYWFTYKDLGSNAVTVEDFYTPDFFFGMVKKVLQDKKIDMQTLDTKTENDRIKTIKAFLHKSKNQQDTQIDVKVIAEAIKQRCAEEITKNTINKDKITQVLDALRKKINTPVPPQ